MRMRWSTGCTLALILALSPATALDVAAQTTSELDAFWTEVERVSLEGDFEGAKALYDEDAVLVSVKRGRTLLINSVMPEWKQEYDNTRDGKTSSVVSFRFSQLLSDGTTAHQTGIFNYRFESETGEIDDQYIHFQALLIKKDGWKMLMEYQLGPATMEEWEVLEARR